MNNYYKMQHKVEFSEVDFNYNMRVDHVVSHFQNITGLHSTELEIDATTMKNLSNAFWILSKWKVKIFRMPKFEEVVTIETWPTFAKGVRFGREFTISGDNQLLVACSSEWCTLDCDTKRPRRVDSVHYPHDMPHRKDNSGAGEFLQAQEQVDETHYNHTHNVLFTDIDGNKHTNNIVYIKMMLDCFTVEEFSKINFDEMQIAYVSQTFYGEQIKMYKKQTDYGYYIQGNSNDKPVFRCIITCKK